MGKTPAQRQADGQAGHDKLHGDLRDFHAREARKYDDKATELDARGKGRAAARARKVADRNRRKAAEHAAALVVGYDGQHLPQQ